MPLGAVLPLEYPAAILPQSLCHLASIPSWMRQYTNEVPDAARCILIWDALPTPPEFYGKQIMLEVEVGPPTS